MSEQSYLIAPFGLRMPSDLKDRVKVAAARERRSLNFIICEILEREFPAETKTADEAR